MDQPVARFQVPRKQQRGVYSCKWGLRPAARLIKSSAAYRRDGALQVISLGQLCPARWEQWPIIRLNSPANQITGAQNLKQRSSHPANESDLTRTNEQEVREAAELWAHTFPLRRFHSSFAWSFLMNTVKAKSLGGQLRNNPHSKLQNYEDSTSPFIHYMSGEALPSTNPLRPDRPVAACMPVTSSSKNPRTGGIPQMHCRTFLYDESLGRTWVSLYTAAVPQNFAMNQ